mgnify:CR=1 FL=1
MADAGNDAWGGRIGALLEAEPLVATAEAAVTPMAGLAWPASDTTPAGTINIATVRRVIAEAVSADWLSCAFGDIALKSKPKAYLFKLLEFNKQELNDNDTFLAQNTEFESLLLKFMNH